MDKITFENATLVSPAKVTIDNVDYNVTPEQTTGGTALSAGTFNQMQSNIEKSAVAISSTEPSTSEKFWIKKGKNGFNGEIKEVWNCSYSNGVITFQSGFVDGQAVMLYIDKYIKGQTYTISFDVISDVNGAEFYFDGQPDNATSPDAFNDVIITASTTSERHSVTGVLANDITHLRFYRITSSAQSSTATITISNIQIEQNDEATPYETYVEKQILLKNSNGVFEKFYSENNLSQEQYSTTETRIGTWINGEAIYRKVYSTNNVTGNDVEIAHNITNLKNIVKADVVATNNEGVSYIQNNDIYGFKINKIDETKIIASISGAYTIGWTVYYILEYTKTV